MHTSTSIWLIKLYQFRIHHILGQPCSFGRSVYQSVHNSVWCQVNRRLPWHSNQARTKIIPSGGARPPHQKRVLFLFALWGQSCCNVTAVYIQFWISLSTRIPSYSNTMRIAINWATLDNLLQQKKVSQHIYLLPTSPSSNSSATVWWNRTRDTTTESKICDSRML